jgi:hypothetical protein
VRWPTFPPGAIPSRRSATGDRARSSTTSNTQDIGFRQRRRKQQVGAEPLHDEPYIFEHLLDRLPCPGDESPDASLDNLAIPIVRASQDRAGPDHRNVARAIASSVSR